LGSSYTPKRRIVSESDIKQTNLLLKKYNVNIFTHLPYIYNLAGSVKNNCLCWEKNNRNIVHTDVDNYTLECLKSIQYELEIIDKLDCKEKGCVLHIGSTGKLSTDEGLKKVAESINKIDFSNIKKSKLILETMVGRGGVLGRSFNELKYVYDNVNEKRCIGFCIDTCHIFSEGLYDIRKKDNILLMFNDFDKIIGLDKLSLIHLNDSKTEFNSKQDKHATIYDGEIWRDKSVLEYFLNKMREYKINSVLETVEDDYNKIQMI
jgi:apurinic endonuclease APN1